MWRKYDGVGHLFTKRTLVITYLLTALAIYCLGFGHITWLSRGCAHLAIYIILFAGFVVTVFGDWDQRTILRNPLLYIGAVVLLFGLYTAR